MDRDPTLPENNVSPEHPLAELGALAAAAGYPAHGALTPLTEAPERD